MKMSIFGLDEGPDHIKPGSITEILRNADKDPRPYVVMKPPPAPPQPPRQPPPIYCLSRWIENFLYIDLMTVARELISLKGERPMSTPEELAAILSEWAVKKQDHYQAEAKAKVEPVLTEQL